VISDPAALLYTADLQPEIEEMILDVSAEDPYIRWPVWVRRREHVEIRLSLSVDDCVRHAMTFASSHNELFPRILGVQLQKLPAS